MGLMMQLSEVKSTLKLVFLIGSIFAILLSQSAQAIDNLFPTNNDVTNPIPISMDDTMTVASESGSNYQLNSDEVSFKVYHATDSTPTVTIHYACSPYNFGGPTTRFEFWRFNPNENTVVDESGSAGLQPLATFTNASCNSGNNIIYTYSAALNRSAVPGRTNYYVGLVKAIETGGGSTGSINGFKVSINAGFVTFRNLTPGSDTYNAGEPTTFKAFALLSTRFGNQSNSSDAEDDFMFDFSPDCTMANNDEVFLKWSDADVGRPNEGSSGIQFRLFNLTTNSYVTLYNYTGASTGSAVGGSELMYHLDSSGNLRGGPGVNDAYGEASFFAQRHHKYRWIWENVDDNNGIQFWAPFSELNFVRNDCPTTTNITASCNAVTGSVVETHASGDSVPIRVGVRLGTTAAWTWTNLTASPNFSYTIPSSLRSFSQPTQVIVQKRLPNSSPTIWGIWTSKNNSGPAEPCIDPTHWNYTVSLTGPTDTSTGPKSGDSLTLSSTVNNTGDGPGRSYDHQIQVTQGAQYVIDPDLADFQNLGGLGASGTSSDARARSRLYQLGNNIPNGTQICFRARVAPYAGQSTPTSTITSSGWRYSNILCYTIYNLQYDIRVQEPTLDDGPPGRDYPAEFILINEPNGHNSANGQTPSSPRVQIQYTNTYLKGSALSFSNSANGPLLNPSGQSGNSDPHTVIIEVPPSAEVGQEYCVSLRVRAAWGYSDASDRNLNRIERPVDEDPAEACVKINNGPYLQVYGNDIWSGGGFDLDGSGNCTLGPGQIVSHTDTADGGVGAMVEYAALARGPISNFGTAGNSLVMLLAFANSSPGSEGHFGEDRCISEIFDNNGVGGDINDDLWNNARDGLADANSIRNSTESGHQYWLNGDQSWNNSSFNSDNYDNNLTILINGNFDITQNFEISTSGLSIDNVPIIVFIVTGDINIGPGVNRLDGIFIAKGTIDTCAIGPLTDGLAVDPGDQGCDSHLEVNGALMANNIAWRRTLGGTNEASTGDNLDRCLTSGLPFYGNDNNRLCAAETVRFPASYYLADIVFNKGDDGDPNNFPIQRIIDLPPVY